MLMARFCNIFEIFFDALSAPWLESAYDILVSAVVMSIVYQYLVGYMGKGGTKTFNLELLEFKDTYFSLLLFQGAYVWINFRDVAKRTVSIRHKVDGSSNCVPSGKWYPLFKPPREKDRATSTSLQFQCLRLGGYYAHQDAKVVCQIAGFYYGEDEGRVELEDGFWYDIPSMSEHEWGLSGMQKWNQVSNKAKEVFRLFNRAHGKQRDGLFSSEELDFRGTTSPVFINCLVTNYRVWRGDADYWTRKLASVFADYVVQTE